MTMNRLARIVLGFAFHAFAVLALLAPASAQSPWLEFRSDASGFVVSLPQPPVITSRQIGNSKATQTNYLIESASITYLVSVVALEKGTGPKDPGQPYFENLLKNYVEGSKTTLRTSKPATIAGKPGIEAISDAGQSAHQFQLTASGDRIYMVVYVGPKGEESSADPARFRGSFKLID
jgi:hypothetical protein